MPLQGLVSGGDPRDAHTFISHLSVTYQSLISQIAPPARYASTAVVRHARAYARARAARRLGGNGRARCCLGWLVPRKIGRPPGPRLTSMGRVVMRVAALIASLASLSPPDGSSSSIASTSSADSRSSGTVLGEAFSATRAHTAHGKRSAGTCCQQSDARSGWGMAARIPDFLSLRVLRSFGVGRLSTPYTSALAMAAAAEGVSGNWPRWSCICRRSHQTRADLFWPDLDTPSGRPVLALILRPSTPNGVVE